jgi:hypothetical protein
MLIQRIGKYRKEFSLLLVSIMLMENYALAKSFLSGSGRQLQLRSNIQINDGSDRNVFLPASGVSSDAEQKDIQVTNKTTLGQNKKRSSDIGGPGQPEMQSFQATGVSNMVDLFSGDFSYNIPLMDAGGYPINIHYSSSISMDQDASWVGLGWNINPGTINRNMRGLPDDFNGKDSITKTLNIKKNVSVGVTFDFNPEVVGKEIKLPKYSTTIEYNNYTGIGFGVGVSPTINSGRPNGGKFTHSLDLNLSLGSKEGFGMSPSFSLTEDRITKGMDGFTNSIGLNFNSRRGLTDLQISSYASRKEDDKNRVLAQGSYALSFARTSYTPTIQIPFTSLQFSFRGKLGGEITVFHPLGAIGGYYSEQTIALQDRKRKLPAFGFLYYQNANNQQEVLLDYNRESDNPYSPKLPHIGIPAYTNDVFSVSGEGNSGIFRAYRGDIGYIRDPKIKSKSNTGGASVDFGAGNIFHAGIDLTYNHSYTETHEWVNANSLRNSIQFRNADTTFEPVYFRNPNERTINASAYYNAIGGDDLIRVNLGDGSINPQASNTFTKFSESQKPSGSSAINYTTIKNERDKRTQVFTYLNAKETSIVGLDSMIHIYPVNKFFVGECDSINCIGGVCDTIKKESRINEFRKEHHISEITVLNPDGKRYIYGVPAYNLTQSEYTFAVNKNNGNLQSGLVTYSSQDKSENNIQGKDQFFSKEEVPAYAHSYLLTGLISSDYVDVTGNGISDDDLGDAVKFNYSRIYSKTNPYKWRTPFDANKVSYSEGLRTDNSDDKGHLIYGAKEIWYLHSVESKTMIATFTLNDTSVSKRKDSYDVIDEYGGRSSNRNLRYLKRIDLYTKSDFIKNGSNAKPVKSVHFEYTYELVPNTPSNSGIAEYSSGQNINANAGKLTLKKIWFTYNGNNKGSKNPYVFTYHSNNPSYDARNSDRWGTYKSTSSNPSSMLNSEFPYAIQDSTTAANNAASWVLQTIKLPSGGVIKVDYESDEYAFVQNKRATQMFKVAGFSNASNTVWGAISNKLYNSSDDNLYMFVLLSSTVSSKQEFFEKYLKGLSESKLYFRAAVQMPTDTYGSGYEFVSGYCNWEDYGLVAGTNNKAWIKVKNIKDVNPVTQAGIQFLRLNLPSKAYPGSDVKNDAAPLAVIKVLGSFASTLKETVLGYNNYSIARGWCKYADTTKSLVRLANPIYKKYGGGLRVKRVLIYDNWNSMTGQKESYYGQEYQYTKTEEIGGVKLNISSGVATYEPTIGNDENPFHIAMEYAEQSSILAPSYGKYIDNPVGESFYPSASVGYSKVRVSSIHRKNAKSATGFEETEFYTARDFPVYSDFTPFDRSSKKQFRSPLRFFLRIDLRQHLTMSQGFRVELNDMHGKVKSQATYAENDTLNPISYTRNYYLTDGNIAKPRLSNKVTVLQKSNGEIVSNSEVAKDVELMVDMREQQSETFGVNVEINKEFFVIPAIIPIFLAIPSWIPLPNHDLKRFRSVTVMKIISRYGVLDSVVHYEKGSKISTKNIVYDSETGDVVLTRTQNEFDDPMYSFSYPAYQAYDALGLAYKNINAVINNIAIIDGRLSNTYYDKFFTGGDEVIITTSELNTKCDNTGYSTTPIQTHKLWAIEGAKIGKPNGIYFIDRWGKLFAGHYYSRTIKIIRSGRRNLLGDAGSIVSLKNPIVPVGQSFKIQFDSSTNILNASAAEYKEIWKVEDRFYLKDTSYIQVYNSNPTFSPTEIVTKRVRIRGDGGQNLGDESYPPYINTYVAAAYDYVKYSNGACTGTNRHSFAYHTKTALRFDFGSFPPNYTIDSAKAYLISKIPNNPPLYPSEHFNVSLCSDKDNYNWSSANSNFRYDNGALQYALKRITQPWVSSTPFNSFQVSQTNKVVLNNYTNPAFAGVVCTPLISDIITNSNSNGIMFEVTDTDGNLPVRMNGGNSETNYLTYCAESNTPPQMAILEQTQAIKSGPSLNDDNYNIAGFCNPQIQVWYKYWAVVNETLCRSALTQKSSNPYVMGYLGNWRPYRSYVYYGDRKETDLNTTNIRTEGTFKTFTPFWAFDNNGITASYDSTKWVWNSEITKINRRGMELENKDPLGRYNAGLYGYNATLPVAVAQNSKYQEIAFDGFEDYGFLNDKCAKPCSTYNHLNLAVDTSLNLSTTEKHSGKYSLKVPAYGFVATKGIDLPGYQNSISINKLKFDTINPFIISPIDTNKVIVNPNQTDKYCYTAVHTDSSALLPRYSPVPGSAVVVGAWVKEAQDCNCQSYTNSRIRIDFRRSDGTLITIVQIKPSGSIIEGWQRIDSAFEVPINTAYYSVFFEATGNTTAYFDDFRIHPFNSNMKSFVYNPVNLRLMAELDENNYASFYEYDDEGTLIRVKKETIQGIKTIKETRSALIKQ